MDDFTIPGCDDDGPFKQFLALYDAPAYIRRARQTEHAYEDLLSQCRQQRAEWLEPVRKRLAGLRTLIQDWGELRPWLTEPGQVDILEKLEEELRPLPAALPEPVWFARPERVALRELCAGLERFNHRWTEFLRTLDLDPVNSLRDGYNRWYVLEKECAVRSPRVARQGFRPLPPVTREEVADLFPLLPIPVLVGRFG